MEGLVVGIMEIGGIVDSGSAKEKDIISFKDKVNILESDFSGIFICSVDKITHKSPVYKVC